ncbi:MAG: DUF4143 domain-containing protein, partial [Propionibacteriaceae bacterium]|nr:DUF4143 domain-containing protein [Propionibacteriaceae bacterium]
SYAAAGLEPPLFYYRDKEKREIDLIILRDQVIQPIEVKKSVSASIHALSSFRVLDPLKDTRSGGSGLKVRVGTGAVVCMAEDVVPLDASNTIVPAWVI